MSLPIPGVTHAPPFSPAHHAGLSPFEDIAIAMAAPANDDSHAATIAATATPPAAILDALAAAKRAAPPAPSGPAPGAPEDSSLYQLFLEARAAIRASAPRNVPPALAPLVAAAPPEPATRSVSEIVAAIAASLNAQAEVRRDSGPMGDRASTARRVTAILPMFAAPAADDRDA